MHLGLPAVLGTALMAALAASTTSLAEDPPVEALATSKETTWITEPLRSDDLAGPQESLLLDRIHALIARPAVTRDQRAGERPIAPEVGLVLLSLNGRHAVMIEPDKVFHAASTMKVPVMIELFRQAKAGRLRLDEPLPIVNDFHSIVDGSVYHLRVGDDSDAEVYKAVGKTMTLRELCEAMITVSSNLAANLLIERLGVENIRVTVARLGATGMNVRRGVEDQKAFDQGLNNTTTARGLAVLLQKLARGKAVDARSDAEMVAILKRQKFNDGIPAGVPEGTPVAHKTGTITKIHHDAAIVYGRRPYVLVILVRGIQDEKESAALMAAISKEVWTARAEPAPARR
jgi:beta-lactamase class A